jgi:hypothetical protein
MLLGIVLVSEDGGEISELNFKRTVRRYAPEDRTEPANTSWINVCVSDAKEK